MLTVLLAALLLSESIIVASGGYQVAMGALATLFLVVSGIRRVSRRLIKAALLSWIVPVVVLLLRTDEVTVRLLLLILSLFLLEVIGWRSHCLLSGNDTETSWRSKISYVPLMCGLLVFTGFSSHPLVGRSWFLLQRLVDLTNWGNLNVGFSASGGETFLLTASVVISSLLLRPTRGQFLGLILVLASYLVGKQVLAILAPVTAIRLSLFHLGYAGWCALLITRFSWIARDQLRIHRLFQLSTALILLALVSSLGLHKGFDWAYRGKFHLLGKLGLINLPKESMASTGEEPATGADSYLTRPDIVIYTQGLLNWEVPSPDRIGLINAGMFGLFRKGLERLAESYNGKVILTDSVSVDCLSNAWLTVFINPTRIPTNVEVDLLRDFLHDGGSMLVLGDHTDIEGSMSALNTIISFSAIKFNFDSAIGLRKYWHGCLRMGSHDLTRGLRNEIFLQIAIGASLTIDEPAMPIVIGRYGFSDKGDYSNVQKAFMGNLKHERGERLGDLVLVACQRVGKGRILVFGDTSPFQNGALCYSWQLVENSLRWLAGLDEGSRVEDEQMAVGWDRRLGTAAGFRWPGFADEKALLDFSMMPMASLQPYENSSLGGLANSLARVGIEARAVVSTEDWSSKANYLFIVDPTKRMGKREMRLLKDFMWNGGHIILSQGYSGWRRFQLCKQMGLAIDSIPLGSGEKNDLISHKEAWPISIVDGFKDDPFDTLVLATAFGYPTVVSRRFGKGTFTLIADGRLLFDENLETERGGNLVNIRFVEMLIQAVRRVSEEG